MPLKLHNLRSKSDFVTGLYLSPMAEVKTCVASIGGGSLAAGGLTSAIELTTVFLKFASMPFMILTGIGTIAFLSAADIIQDKMIKRSMNKSDVVIKTQRRPQIDV